MKINVLRLIGSLDIGGVERRLVGLLPLLDSQKFNVSVCCIRERGKLADELEARGIPVHLIKFKTRLHPASIKSLVKFLREKNIHILHTHMYRSNTSGTIAGIVAKTPIIISNLHNFKLWDNWRQRLMEQILANKRDATIAVSEAVREKYLKHIHIHPAKVITIYNGVDLNRFYPRKPDDRLRVEFGISEGEKVAGMVCRLHPDKDPFLFIKAINLLRMEKERVKFLVVGSGSLEIPLRQFAASSPYKDRIIFTGMRDDIPQILSLMDLVVSASRTEGFSNTILEAFAMAKPVICTDVGGNREVIRDGFNGFLFPVGDENSLAQIMEKLINDENLRRKIGESALETVQQFSLQKMIERTEELYLRLFAAKFKSTN